MHAIARYMVSKPVAIFGAEQAMGIANAQRCEGTGRSAEAPTVGRPECGVAASTVTKEERLVR